jgi:CheY-like chemotaxis protein
MPEKLTPKIEKEPQLKKEIWLVEDNESLARSLIRLWEGLELDYVFNHFPTAKSLFEEIEKRLKEIKDEKIKKVADIIFMDGNLEEDEGELRDGAQVIKKIREIKEMEQPIIVAFSSDFVKNVEMMLAGANLSLGKMQSEKIEEFLKQPEEFLKKLKEESK